MLAMHMPQKAQESTEANGVRSQVMLAFGTRMLKDVIDFGIATRSTTIKCVLANPLRG